MRTLIRGEIRNFTPYFKASIEKGQLVFRENGNLLITIDTGFGGGIALPEEVLRKMKVILISYGVFKLATGDEIELPIFWGKISIRRYEIETWFTYGEFLAGMEFLSSVGTYLSFDFKKREVRLMK